MSVSKTIYKTNSILRGMIDIQKLHWHLHENENIPKIVRVPILIASNFLFQGTVYMDKTERMVTIALTITLGVILRYLIPFSGNKWAKSVIVSHLFNFVFNGHPWAFVIHQINPNATNTSEGDFDHWLNRLETLGTKSESIAAIAVYGSLARTELSTSSDLDVRVVSYPNKRERVTSSLLICRERIRAALMRFPLDIYVCDSPDSLSRLRDDEQPEILVDKEDWL